VAREAGAPPAEGPDTVAAPRPALPEPAPADFAGGIFEGEEGPPADRLAELEARRRAEFEAAEAERRRRAEEIAAIAARAAAQAAATAEVEFGAGILEPMPEASPPAAAAEQGSAAAPFPENELPERAGVPAPPDGLASAPEPGAGEKVRCEPAPPPPAELPLFTEPVGAPEDLSAEGVDPAGATSGTIESGGAGARAAEGNVSPAPAEGTAGAEVGEDEAADRESGPEARPVRRRRRRGGRGRGGRGRGGAGREPPGEGGGAAPSSS
jgi:ribonuclease E